MNIIDRINADFSSMTRTQKRIAEYIIGNYQRLAFVVLEDLAADIGVSTTSIIRFARSLEFSGYTEMQQRIRDELMKKISLPERLESSRKRTENANIMEENLKLTIQNLQATADHIDDTAVNRAVEAIVGARQVYISGACFMYSVAHYMYACLSLSVENVKLLSGVGGISPEELVSAGPGDVCIAYIFPRYQNIQLKLIGYLRERGVTVIVLTSLIYDAITNLGDIFICCSLQGLMNRDSILPAIFLTDYLIAMVVNASDYTRTKERNTAMEEMIKRFYMDI